MVSQHHRGGEVWTVEILIWKMNGGCEGLMVRKRLGPLLGEFEM